MLKKSGILILLSLFIFVSTIFTYFSCNSKTTQKDEIDIYTSIEPIKFLIDSISGGEISVRTLIKPGSDPHTFEISTRQLSDILNSKAYFSIDIPFEKTIIGKIKDQKKSFKVYHLYEIDEITDDVHIWLSIPIIKVISQNILNILIELYPDKKDIFANNHDNLLNKLNSLDDSVRFNIESSNIKTFLVFHPSLTYFANDYGLTQISIENEGKVPSGSYLLDINKKIEENKIRFIIVQPEFPVEQISQFVKENNLEIVTVDILNYNLFDTLLKISEIFVRYKN